MSKLSTYTPVLIAASFILPLIASAAQLQPTQGTPKGSQAFNIVNNFLGFSRLIVTLLFVLAVLVFAWGAVKLILAAGDPEAIKKAKSFMWWGVIAMAVLASVFGLVTFLQSYFGVEGGGGFQNVNIPNAFN